MIVTIQLELRRHEKSVDDDGQFNLVRRMTGALGSSSLSLPSFVLLDIQ